MIHAPQHLSETNLEYLFGAVPQISTKFQKEALHHVTSLET